MNSIPAVKTLDDVRALLRDLPGPDKTAAEAAEAREPQLTKPRGSLGRLEELAQWLAAWQGTHPPAMDNPAANVFAGNHGVTEQGVSAFPAEVTHQMVANFEHGGAAINQLCKTFGIRLRVEALDLDTPVRDFTRAPAMTDSECARAMMLGMETVPDAANVLCLGEMGIGNTTSAAAIAFGLYGGDAQMWTGPGTGVSGKALSNKAVVVGDGVRLHKDAMRDGLEVLRCLGGRELAAIAGAVIGARLKKIPVLLDGYVSTAAAAPLQTVNPAALDHCQVAHVSAEPSHRLLVEKIGKHPLLDLGMRLGEASGAALAVGILKAAVNCHAGMATFAEAGVSDAD
ncbi:MAG: nicotinate-nucleotide--dimethylbenzimidazole phosphoribosyltransferase [Rhodospirillales bacterium]|nr:nicotinate-nucleotide--dimethylbenzimidazole phosphoribosyltransferase [Rhodospirillales bacterium]